MSPLSNLTGRWVGHYEQTDQKRPISAELVQDGAKLKGSMRDGEPDRDCSLFELAAEAGLPPGADEQIDANLRAMIPDAPAGAIRYIWHLPPDSRLEGRCNGRVVSFIKTYMGTTFSGYKVGDKILGRQNEGHAVHYEGQLSPDGLEIEGRWWIDPEPNRGTRRAEGYFLLRRQAEAPQPPFHSQQAGTGPAEQRTGWRSWLANLRG
jgi:hypothetical protein